MDTEIHILRMTGQNGWGILGAERTSSQVVQVFMQVYECMQADPITITPETTYAQASRLLRVKRLHALPVLDQERRMVGIVTEKDLLDISPVAVLGADTLSNLLAALKVEEAMTRPVITVQEDDTVEAAARLLVDRDIGCLPVLRGDRLTGLVTRQDILRAMIDAFGDPSDGLRLRIRLPEDRGELAAITDGIIKAGGRLTCLITHWGADPVKRTVTLKVQGIDREEFLMMLEGIIGVQVLDCSEIRLTPDAIASAMNAEGEVLSVVD
jgi:acetoin utilization protein AcuB